jgi:serine O-acetyltransferase
MPQDKNKPKQFEAYGQPIDGCPDPVLRTIEDLRGQVAHLMDRVAALDAQKQTADEEESVTEKKPAASGRS